MGPTASGKTALAVELVKRFPLQIISVDSAMVYRGLDIGTAKPDDATMRIAPHRLIDILEPTDSYSAAQFRADAWREIQAIMSTGHIPLLVGGTMLYFRALLQGLTSLPPADSAVRQYLEAERAKHGLPALHERLMKIDPLAAARIHANDAQRIQRALEVFMITGRPVTELYRRPRDEVFPFQAVKFALNPGQRSQLHQRIEARFYEMLDAGFVDEVAGLRARRELNLDKPALRAVGYRQVWQYLEGATDYDTMVQRGIIATRQFAKRQLTWLRNGPESADSKWYDSTVPQLLDQAIICLQKTQVLPK